VKLNDLIDVPTLKRHRLAMGCALGIVVLALVETANALLAPLTAPSDGDWRKAAVQVRAGFRPGDLIVAAPAWADPLVRQHLGDLIPLPVAGRMDAARFGRIWEVAQRGSKAPEVAGAKVEETGRHGGLTVRRYQREPAHVLFDFVADWNRASVSRNLGGGQVNFCNPLGDRFQCPDVPGSPIKPDLLEIDTTPRWALGVPMVGSATTAMEYDRVPLGRELVVGVGLHNVWLRKAAKGTVTVRVLVAGRELGRLQAGSMTGWTLRKLDTAGLAGQTATVRFEITADDPNSRHLGLAAEARQ
jgi:hypothetical protein